MNTRTDAYGASIAGRNRFALEVAGAAAQAIGADKVGMRVSPYGVFNGTGAFPDVDAQYLALVRELSTLGLLYVHQLDHTARPEGLRFEAASPAMTVGQHEVCAAFV